MKINRSDDWIRIPEGALQSSSLGGYAPTTNPLPFLYHFDKIKYRFRIHTFNRKRVPLSHAFTATLYYELIAKKGSLFVISM